MEASCSLCGQFAELLRAAGLADSCDSRCWTTRAFFGLSCQSSSSFLQPGRLQQAGGNGKALLLRWRPIIFFSYSHARCKKGGGGGRNVVDPRAAEILLGLIARKCASQWMPFGFSVPASIPFLCCRYNTDQFSPYAVPSPQGSYQPSPSPQSFHQVAPSPVGYQNTQSPASYHPTPSPMAYQVLLNMCRSLVSYLSSQQ